VFTPKWGTDQEPGNRIFCVVRKWENPEVFNKLFGHVAVMTGEGSISLETAAKQLRLDLPREVT
jgi:hypothetical protein